MDQIVLAIIGVAGLLVPALVSTRFGKWRLLHQIQEQSKTYDAIPDFLVEEREVLAEAIKETVESSSTTTAVPTSQLSFSVY